MFGFLINLPIINYYEHATYLTANHGHTALFGVYGMLAIALILFSWRGLVREQVLERRHPEAELLGPQRRAVPDVPHRAAADRPAAGLAQLRHRASGSPAAPTFYELPLVQTLGNWRIVPDTIIIVLGAFPLLYFLLSTYPRLRKAKSAEEGARST